MILCGKTVLAYLLLSGALLALSARAGSGQASPGLLPETPAGRQMQRLLDVLADGRPETIRAFIRSALAASFLEEIPETDHVQAIGGFARETGGVVPERILESSPNRLRLLARAKNDSGKAVVVVVVGEGSDAKIAGLGFRRADPSDTLELPPLPEGKPGEKAVASYLETVLERLARADAFSGAVLVAREGKPVFRRAYGLASRAWNAPNRPDTKFNLGSMNKMITSVAIAQLMEEGKLDWKDPLGKHLPDWPNAEAAKKVTLHHLLTHTSGIGDYFNEKFFQASRDRFRAVSDYLPLFAAEPLAFEPGAQFRYSNGGFMTLGAVVEKASGQDYFAYVRQRITGPAGMAHTDAYELDADPPNLATGYTRPEANGVRRTNTFQHVIKGGPAGGGYSTVDDLLRFDQALRTGKLIRPETFARVLTADGARATEGYGYGFSTERINGQRVAGHGGGFPGISAQLDMYLDSGWTVAVLSNYDRMAQVVSQRLRPYLTR